MGDFLHDELCFSDCPAAKLSVYSVVENTTDLRKHILIGEAETTMAEVVKGILTQNLYCPGKAETRGTIQIISEQIEDSASVVELRITGKGITKKMFTKGPFLRITKVTEPGKYVPVYQTEIDPKFKWKTIKISYQTLCNLDPDRPLRICLFAAKSGSSDVLRSWVDTTFNQMSENNWSAPSTNEAREFPSAWPD